MCVCVCVCACLTHRRMSELRKEERQSLVTHLTAYPLTYTGHEGYKKAEVRH